jgi:hypothetical protein
LSRHTFFQDKQECTQAHTRSQVWLTEILPKILSKFGQNSDKNWTKFRQSSDKFSEKIAGISREFPFWPGFWDLFVKVLSEFR